MEWWLVQDESWTDHHQGNCNCLQITDIAQDFWRNEDFGFAKGKHLEIKALPISCSEFITAISTFIIIKVLMAENLRVYSVLRPNNYFKHYLFSWYTRGRCACSARSQTFCTICQDPRRLGWVTKGITRTLVDANVYVKTMNCTGTWDRLQSPFNMCANFYY